MTASPPPHGLGAVERDVRGLQQVPRRHAVSWSESDADAGAAGDLASGDAHRLRHYCQDAVGGRYCFLRMRLLQQYRELVAAEPGDRFAPVQAGHKPAGNGDQLLVANLVAEAVVDDLEPVQVEEQHADASPVRASPF